MPVGLHDQVIYKAAEIYKTDHVHMLALIFNISCGLGQGSDLLVILRPSYGPWNNRFVSLFTPYIDDDEYTHHIDYMLNREKQTIINIAVIPCAMYIYHVNRAVNSCINTWLTFCNHE